MPEVGLYRLVQGCAPAGAPVARGPGASLAFADGMQCAEPVFMPRLSLLCVLLLAPLARAQRDAGPDEVRQLMKEGMERQLPAPSTHAHPDWPRAEAPPRPSPPDQREQRLDSMAERVRQDATARARAAGAAEERRTTPDNQPGASQSRTKAAKAATPGQPRPNPPRP